MRIRRWATMLVTDCATLNTTGKHNDVVKNFGGRHQ